MNEKDDGDALGKCKHETFLHTYTQASAALKLNKRVARPQYEHLIYHRVPFAIEDWPLGSRFWRGTMDRDTELPSKDAKTKDLGKPEAVT